MRKPLFNLMTFPVSGLSNPEGCATAYVAISQQACFEYQSDGETHVRAALEGETPAYWGIYGRNVDGTVEWIADFGNELMCWMVSAQLAHILGVFVEGASYNVKPLEAAVYMMNHTGEPN